MFRTTGPPSIVTRTPLHAVAVLLCLHANAQNASIVMDGRFNDWTPGLASLSDPDVPSSGVDLQGMQVTNDASHLFIRLTVGTEIDLQDNLVPQTIRLYIDGDDNSATGNAVQTGYGAELQIRFDTRTVTEYWGTSSNVSWSTLDLVPLPTTTGTEFEIAIARNAMPDGTNLLFSSNTIKLLFRETDGGDAMPDDGSTFSYTFDDSGIAPFVPVPVERADPTHVRISAWNVLSDGLTNAGLQGPYQRILSALAPDIIGFSECVSSTAAQVKTRLDTWLPIGGTGWYVEKDDYDMVIASRWPILQTWPSLTRQFAALIDLPSSHATDLLFTAAHLHCCTADNSRQNECDEYVQFVRDAMSPGGSITLPANTPMVYAGDLNSVGYVQQMNTLLTGDIVNNATYGPDSPMDWDGTAITAAEVEQTDAPMAYTWRSNTSAYPSGRLDHLLYTDGVMTLAGSFTLRTEVMPMGTLSALGLNATDASAASDHFAITADLDVPGSGLFVSLRAFLGGPYDANTGLMHDSLRVLGLIPLNEPYTSLGFTQAGGGGGASVQPQVLAITGNDAIVDWVMVELRSAIDPSGILATRCALLQRDGDVVDTDGSSPVRFELPAGTYHIALRHRDHLGVMTASAVGLTNTTTPIDLTLPTAYVFENDGPAMNTSGGVRLLWQGEVARDGRLKYTGTGNDRDPVLVAVGGGTPNLVVEGVYSEADVNMDGRVKYTGSGNDRDPILVNVGGGTPNAVRTEQLP